MTANGCLHTVSTISLLPSYFHSTKARKNGFFRGDNSTVFVEHIFLSLRALRMSVQSLRWSNAYWPPVFGEVPVLADGECSLLPAVLVRRSQASKHTGELPPPPSLFFPMPAASLLPSPPLPIQPHSWASRPPGAKEDFCWRRQEGARGKERHRGALAESFGRKISFFAALLCFMELQEPTMCNKLIQNVQLKKPFLVPKLYTHVCNC